MEVITILVLLAIFWLFSRIKPDDKYESHWEKTKRLYSPYRRKGKAIDVKRRPPRRQAQHNHIRARYANERRLRKLHKEGST